MNPVVVLDGNARPHKGGSWNNGVTVPPYCIYSPDLTFTYSLIVGSLGNTFPRRLFCAILEGT